MARNVTTCSLILQTLTVLASFTINSYAVQSDIDCLRSIKDSLEDPEQLLSSWNFSNNTDGFVCRFTGIECWHEDESKVLGIRLSAMGLRGPFPVGIRACKSLTSLDLSKNYLTGHIPSHIADFIPFVTGLDLSNNNFSGPIPPSIGNLSFINVLKLNDNQLTGQIPPELSKLDRIKLFTVANNRLSGQVPIFQYLSISEESYAHNQGLCGEPLSPCKDENENLDHLFFAGFAVGLPVSTTLTTLLILCWLPRLSMSNIKKIKGRKRHVDQRSFHGLFNKEDNTKDSKITTMGKYIRRLRLMEVELATDDFDSKNVIGYGNMGLMYKAVFPSGLMLAVKRLHKFESFEKEFPLEIEILGRLRHVNLVPLLCYCFEMEKKFLVYKYISNGTLHQWLHSKPQVEDKKMGWSLRLRIAVGIARGLAWLHHNHILRVAHLKISSSCILLDDKFEPKISNFGNSAILMNTTYTLSSGCTFVVPHSSPGPYKEDIYSFGILLLELVSGRERLCAEIGSTRDSVSSEEFNMIDECLTGQGFDEEIYEMLKIAESCIQTHKDGARSMLEVYQSIRVVGIPRNEISVDLYIDLEGTEGGV